MSEYAPALEAPPDPAAPAESDPVSSAPPRTRLPARRRKREDLARRAAPAGPSAPPRADAPPAPPAAGPTAAQDSAEGSEPAPTAADEHEDDPAAEILADIVVWSVACAPSAEPEADLILLAGGIDLPRTPAAPVEPLPDTLEALDTRLRAAGPIRIAIVVGGDPLEDGPGRPLLAALGPGRVRLHPAAGPMQRALSRIGFSPEDACILRLSRLGEAGLLARLRRGRLFGIDPSPGAPQSIGQLLERAGFHQARTWVVGPDPGRPVRAMLAFELSDSTEDFPDDNQVIVYTAGADGSSRDWPGIPATELDRAPPEAVRLLALAWLQPGAEECGWCIEGEHPALALDWSRERPDAELYCIGCCDEELVTALERHQAGERMRGVAGGSFRDLEPLPSPNVVFVRAGEEFTQQIRTAWERLLPGGRMVAIAEDEHARLDLMQFAHRHRPAHWQDLTVAVGEADERVSLAPPRAVRVMGWAKPPRA